MNRRLFFSLLAAIAGVLLSVGAAGAVAIAANNPLSLLKGTDAQPSAAVLVPKQAPLMVSLLANPDRLEAFRQASASPGRRRAVRAEWRQVRDGLLAKTGLDYASDVRPWLGDELTWAVTDLDVDRDGENGRQPGYLLVAATRDPARSRDFLQRFWQKQALAGVELNFEQYKGAKLVYGTALDLLPPLGRFSWGGAARARGGSPPLQTVATATVGDRFVLFASDPRVLRDAINNVQAPALSLDSSPEYQRAIAAMKAGRVAAFFANLPALKQWLGAPGGGGPTASDGAIADAIANPSAWPYRSAVASLGLTPAGLVADLAAIAPDLPAARPELDGPVPALAYLPREAALAIGGRDLAALWERARDRYGETGLGRDALAAIDRLQDRWGSDLAGDVLAWARGDYALGLLPASLPAGADAEAVRRERALGSFPGDWVFAARRLPETEAALDRLDDLARQRGLSVGSLDLGGNRQATVWTQLVAQSRWTLGGGSGSAVTAQVQGVHGTAGPYELFATSVPALAAALESAPLADPAEAAADGANLPARPSESFLAVPAFRTAIAALPVPNDGCVYLDWPRSRAALRQAFPALRVADLAVGPLLDRLQTAALSSRGSDAGLQRASLFLQGRPPLPEARRDSPPETLTLRDRAGGR